MARGPIVTPEVEGIIASVYRKHSKWKAREIQSEVKYLVHKKYPKLPREWPSLSTTHNVIASVRKQMRENPIYPEDKPWSMATLDAYSISPKPIPAVLKVWQHRIKTKAGFTIREAKWAARLSILITDVDNLSGRASQYANLEKIHQIIGRDFDSTGLDMLIMGFPVTMQEGFLPVLADLESGVDLIRDLKQGKIKEITMTHTGAESNLVKEKAERIPKILKGGKEQ